MKKIKQIKLKWAASVIVGQTGTDPRGLTPDPIREKDDAVLLLSMSPRESGVYIRTNQIFIGQTLAKSIVNSLPKPGWPKKAVLTLTIFDAMRSKP